MKTFSIFMAATMVFSSALFAKDLSSYSDLTVADTNRLMKSDPKFLKDGREGFADGMMRMPEIKKAIFTVGSNGATYFQVTTQEGYFSNREKAILFATLTCKATNGVTLNGVQNYELQVDYVSAGNDKANLLDVALVKCSS